MEDFGQIIADSELLIMGLKVDNNVANEPKMHDLSA